MKQSNKFQDNGRSPNNVNVNNHFSTKRLYSLFILLSVKLKAHDIVAIIRIKQRNKKTYTTSTSIL